MQIKFSEPIVAQNPRKIKLSGDPSSFQAPGKKEDFLAGKQARVFPDCCLLEAIAAHLSQSLLKEGGVA